MANENSERCPKCFNKFSDNLWTDDPILSKNGAKFIYDEESGLLISQTDISKRYYKGFLQIKSQVIKELQENREQAEIDAGILEEDRTVFSSVEDDVHGFYIFNLNHIKELRESTEKILVATGQTKEEYFNYDSEGTERQIPHQLDWIDSVLENWKGQIKDQHIEDLRKFLSIKKLWFNYLSANYQPAVYNNIYELRVRGTDEDKYIEKTNTETPSGLSYQTFRWTVPRSALAKDSFWSTGLLDGNDCIFKFGRSTNNLCILQKYIKFIDIETISIRYWFTNYYMHIFTDNNYIYCCGTGNGNLGFVKLDIDGNIIQYQYYNVGNTPKYLESMITMDNQYFYLMIERFVSATRKDYCIRRYNKLNFAYIDEHTIFSSDTTNYFWSSAPAFGWGYQLIVDTVNIYVLQSLFNFSSTDSWLKLYTYNKTTFNEVSNVTIATRSDPMKFGFYINSFGQTEEFFLLNVPVGVLSGEFNKYVNKSNISEIYDIPIPTFDVYSPLIMNFSSDWERNIRTS